MTEDVFSVGQYVVYGQDGVCEVMGIGRPETSGLACGGAYYFLRPVGYKGMIYAPVERHAPMRPALDKEGALNLIRRMASIPAQISRATDKKLLEAHYGAMLKDNTCEAYVQTIRSIYEKRAAKPGAPGRLNATEERIYKRAERSLFEEFSVALGIPPERVASYIEAALSGESGDS